MRRILFSILLFSLALITPCRYLGAENTVTTVDFGQGVILPVFRGAKDIWGGPQITEINTLPVKIACFNSNSLPTEIINFYKGRLIELGWQLEMDLPWLNLIYFKKDANFLYVGGSGIFGIEENVSTTNFVLVLAQQPIHLCVNFGPNFKETPGKDFTFIPRYPGSVRVASITREEKEGFFVYISRDFARNIADFYYKNLPRHGWQVDREGRNFSPINSLMNASYSLQFKRGSRDRLNIYITFCNDNQVNVVIVSYNNVFNESAIWTFGGAFGTALW